MPEPRYPIGLHGRKGGSSLNGMPERQPYDLRAGRDAEAAREAQVAARLADLRAKLAGPGRAVTPSSPPAPAPVPGAPTRCPDCGYLTNARGHLAECEAPDA